MISESSLIQGRNIGKSGNKGRENNVPDMANVRTKGLIPDDLCGINDESALDKMKDRKKNIEDPKDELAIALEKTKIRLKQKEELISQTQLLSRTGSFEMKVDDGGIEGSDMFYKLFGFDPSSDISIDQILSYVHPDDNLKMDTFIHGFLKGNEPQKVEFRFVNPKALTEQVLFIKTVTLQSEKGKKVIGIVQEITGHKIAESALLESNRELEAFNKAMMDREIRIIEMKEEVNSLCKELGRDPYYP